jgi:hypothetical protein
MPKLMRNPASCGGQILSGLNEVNFTWLRKNLSSIYKLWDKRIQDGEGYEGDGEDLVYSQFSFKIYKGETIIFSDKDIKTGGGNRLAEKVLKYGLGDIASLGTVNPNTGNKIRTWIWVYNGKQISK